MRQVRIVVVVALLAGCRGAASSVRTEMGGTGVTAPFGIELQKSGTTASLRGVSVVNDRVVWASGSRGTVLRTVDGGGTWRADTVAGATALDFRDVHGLSADEAIVVATAGRMYRTNDGGRSWKVVYAASDTSVFLDAISFWDAKHGIVIGDPMGGAFFILLTDDGGMIWRELPKDQAPQASAGEAAFAASGTCLTVWGSGLAWFGTGGGSEARVFRSADRGRSWSVASTPIVAGDPAAGIFSVAFEDSLNGSIAGGNYRVPSGESANLAFTKDGGRTFTLQDRRPAQYLSAIAITGRPMRLFFGVGIAGITYASHSAQHWATTDSTAWNAIAFGESRGWVVGPDGKIGRIE